MDRNHVVFPTNICHPDEIVELVKGELATAIQTDMNTFILSTILFVTPEYGS
jgi:hypothetical protein